MKLGHLEEVCVCAHTSARERDESAPCYAMLNHPWVPLPYHVPLCYRKYPFGACVCVERAMPFHLTLTIHILPIEIVRLLYHHLFSVSALEIYEKSSWNC